MKSSLRSNRWGVSVSYSPGWTCLCPNCLCCSGCRSPSESSTETFPQRTAWANTHTHTLTFYSDTYITHIYFLMIDRKKEQNRRKSSNSGKTSGFWVTLRLSDVIENNDSDWAAILCRLSMQRRIFEQNNYYSKVLIKVKTDPVLAHAKLLICGCNEQLRPTEGALNC